MRIRISRRTNCGVFGTKRWLIDLSRGSAAVKVCYAKDTLYIFGKSRDKNHIFMDWDLFASLQQTCQGGDPCKSGR